MISTENTIVSKYFGFIRVLLHFQYTIMSTFAINSREDTISIERLTSVLIMFRQCNTRRSIHNILTQLSLLFNEEFTDIVHLLNITWKK